MNHNELKKLYKDIEVARNSYVDCVTNLSNEQTGFKISKQEWSIVEITEHLVWAEQIGLWGMFNAIESVKNNMPLWTGLSPNTGLSIEEIVILTWQPKEEAPSVAMPRWGGNLDYWLVGLKNNANLLWELVLKAEQVDLTLAIYPHPISGPMDVIQRLEFLSFHLKRHELQVKRVKSHRDYPK